MELRDYLRVLSKNWIFVVAMTLVGFGLSLGVSALMTQKYESTTTLYVSVQTGGTGDLFQGASFAQTAVTSYVDVVTAAIVLNRVIDDLGLSMQTSELEDLLTVSTPAGSVLINITAVHPDPAMVAAIANATGTAFIDVVENEIENSAEGEASPVRVRTIDPGSVPAEPASPNMVLNGALGFLLGLTLGVGAAIIRDMLDTRIHCVEDLEMLTDLPVIGRIALHEQLSQRPLVVHEDPRSPRSEAFRTLRTNLRFIGSRDTPRSYVLSSPMPSEGKTHVVANLAVVLAETGARVALVEADLRRPRLAEVMGIEGGAGLSDVLSEQATLEEVLQPWGSQHLTVLPAGQIPPNPSELLGSPQMQQLLAELEAQNDYVLVDTPPILPVTDAAVVSTFVNGTLLVTAVGKTRRQDVQLAIESLQTTESGLLGIIINKLPVKSSDASGFVPYHDVETKKSSTPRVSRLP